MYITNFAYEKSVCGTVDCFALSPLLIKTVDSLLFNFRLIHFTVMFTH